MERKTRRRTRAHLLRTIKQTVKSPFIVQYRHALVDRMIAKVRRGNREGVQGDGLGAVQN